MALADDIANAFSSALAPIAENTVNSIVNGVKDTVTSLEGDLLAKLSGKEIQVTIKLPDLTK